MERLARPLHRGQYPTPKPTKSAGYCEICGGWRPMRHSDHILPRAAGGGEEAENRQWLCANCHEDKSLMERQDPILGKARNRKIGDGNRGRVHSPETVERLRAQATGRTHSAETRELISSQQRGRKHSPEHVEKVAAKLRGQRRTPEQCERIRQGIRESHARRERTRDTGGRAGAPDEEAAALPSGSRAQQH